MQRSSLRFALILLGVTIAYNVAEGVLAIWSGVRAESLTLVTFGADSYLEVLAASAVVWRLASPDEETGERREGQAMRLVGVTFLVLAAAVVAQAGISLASGHAAEESRFGIGLLFASLLVMPVLSLLKLRTAAAEGLPVLAVEARETIACSYLSLTALAGLIANAVIGWWWIDAVAALLLVPWLVREGREAVTGDACVENMGTCFCRACTWGLRSCSAGCCAPMAA